jgi:hypothetical protein
MSNLSISPKASNVTNVADATNRAKDNDSLLNRKASFRTLFAGGKERLRKKKEQLVKEYLEKNVLIFGNQLSELPKYSLASINPDPLILFDPKKDYSELDLELECPEFVVRCVQRIETMKSFDGLYRINGDAEEVQKLK